jgi:hypothetical protein
VPDWRKLVAEKLDATDLPPLERQDIAAELASHLEEVYDKQRAIGLPETQAVERAWSEVHNWPRLNRKIKQARGKEGSMNGRIRHLWFPGLAGFAAAVICEILLARWSYQPVMLLRPHATQPEHGLWLIAQMFCGGVGAYLSRRAGGTRSARLGAALFTSGVLVVAIVIRICLATGWSSGFLTVMIIIRTIRILALIPSLAMLAGALPFLPDRNQAAVV